MPDKAERILKTLMNRGFSEDVARRVATTQADYVYDDFDDNVMANDALINYNMQVKLEEADSGLFLYQETITNYDTDMSSEANI